MSSLEFMDIQTQKEINIVSDFLELPAEEVYEFLSNQSVDALLVTQDYLQILLGLKLHLEKCIDK
ncbi:MAG: hypothetical protein M0T74_11200 [Desulfitobacterium hafniense]|nr:hypothetical protein [Desulfitobacterium hafniense]